MKKFAELIEKTTKETFRLKPEKVTGDKIYGTNGNRAYMKDYNMELNIAFYDEA